MGLRSGSKESLRDLDPKSERWANPNERRLTLDDPDIALSHLQADGLDIPGLDNSVYDRAARALSRMLDTRMLFSALVDADYIETEAHFAGDGEYRYRTEVAPLDLDSAIEELARYTVALSRDASPEVQAVRDTLLKTCLDAALSPAGLFTLTAPTGSGKTLAMLAFALEHARHHGLRRVVVAIPYLSIIEQTARVYRCALGDEFVLEQHGLAAPPSDEIGLHADNWDAPLVVTTHVQVASLRVEDVSISATARVTGHSRNTVARWLERASTAAKHFNDRMLRDFDLIELQADELCTFIGNKSTTVWLFATIEVSSRLWASSVLGRRSDRNARAVIEDVICRGRVVGCPLIATDGFEYYVGAVGALLGSTCVYGQVLKTRRNNRVVRVERRVKIGTANRLKAALWASEDSETLNTSFVERLNLTIRQASAYLRRRSPCHARDADQLRSHVELVRCHYNFVRPHRALRFGRETRTPAMQARLVSRRLALSDIFTGRLVRLRVFVAVVETAAGGLPPLSWSYEQRAAA